MFASLRAAWIPWGAHSPVATLRHLANLQARISSVKESAPGSHFVQLLQLSAASVNCEDA